MEDFLRTEIEEIKQGDTVSFYSNAKNEYVKLFFKSTERKLKFDIIEILSKEKKKRFSIPIKNYHLVLFTCRTVLTEKSINWDIEIEQ